MSARLRHAIEVLREERARLADAPPHPAVILVRGYLDGLLADLEQRCRTTPTTPCPPASTPTTASGPAPGTSPAA